MSAARRGDIVMVETVSASRSIYGGAGLHVRFRFARVASATRDGVVTKVENPGGQPLRIGRNETVYTLPPMRPEVADLIGETYHDMNDVKSAAKPYRL
jgi:hypothetical protein